MLVPFLNRTRELARMARALAGRSPVFICLYGRRRCGKSRLLGEVLRGCRAVYYVGDEREATLQRRDVARAIAAHLPGFDQVDYPAWSPLLERWWREAPRAAVLALDEFPAMVAAAPALPSILQKLLDGHGVRGPHLVVCGSSQRMMHGLVLSGTAPLYGRAHEVIKLEPLGAHWIGQALSLTNPVKALEAFAVWGGIPRYWELAAEYPRLREAVRALVLDPQGVLHEEPWRILLDDVRETAQAASVLALIGQGCHRLSEIAARLGKPATSLTRPLQRLQDIGLVARHVPFDDPPRSAKKSCYQIADAFLRFWFRYVEPQRSRLATRQIDEVEQEIARSFAVHVGQAWEELARASVARLRLGGCGWRPAMKWWGKDTHGTPAEVDIVAESEDGRTVLLGEAKLSAHAKDVVRIGHMLADLETRVPFLRGRKTVRCIWVAGGVCQPSDTMTVNAQEVLAVLD